MSKSIDVFHKILMERENKFCSNRNKIKYKIKQVECCINCKHREKLNEFELHCKIASSSLLDKKVGIVNILGFCECYKKEEE